MNMYNIMYIIYFQYNKYNIMYIININILYKYLYII